MAYLMPNATHPCDRDGGMSMSAPARSARCPDLVHELAQPGGMDYIMSHNAGALWDQMTPSKG